MFAQHISHFTIHTEVVCKDMIFLGEIATFDLTPSKRYGPPSSSSCGGLRPLVEAFYAFFLQFLGHFLCLLVTLVTPAYGRHWISRRIVALIPIVKDLTQAQEGSCCGRKKHFCERLHFTNSLKLFCSYNNHIKTKNICIPLWLNNKLITARVVLYIVLYQHIYMYR